MIDINQVCFSFILYIRIMGDCFDDFFLLRHRTAHLCNLLSSFREKKWKDNKLVKFFRRHETLNLTKNHLGRKMVNSDPTPYWLFTLIVPL